MLIRVVFLVMGIIFANLSYAEDLKFVIQDIGLYSLDSDCLHALNDRGQILVNQGYIWSNGVLTDTGLFRPLGINNLGQVVGSTVANHNGAIWTNGAIEDLGDYWPHGINDLGEVVGSYGWGNFHAFMYDDGAMTDLGPIGTATFSLAFSVNNQGQVVGWAANSDGISHAFIWDNGSGIVDLGTFGGILSLAYDINDYGQVVGSYLLSDYESRGFLWENGTVTDLGSVGDGLALAINNRGYIVSIGRPMLWVEGEWFDLNDLIPKHSGWLLQGTYGINNRNQIVGIGTIDGESHVYLLTPKHKYKK